MIRLLRLVAFLLVFCLTEWVCAQTLSEAVRAQAEAEGVEFTENNSIVFFDNGQAKFDDLFQAVRAARSSVHMEYFNFRNDSIANALFDLLGQKAQQGVEVRLLFDAFGNSSNNRPLKSRHLERIRATGVEIYKFDPIRFPWLNHIIPRDHRKIVIIDGKTAYSGGMNVADYYIHGTPQVGGWHDIHYRIEGDAVGAYQKIFLRLWQAVTGQAVSGAKYYPGMSYAWNALPGLKSDTTATAGAKTLGVVNREPHTSPKVIRSNFLHLINGARKHIQIINPYFTLNRPIRKALLQAIARGVDVELMVSETSDIPITPRVVDYRARQMQRAGARVYYYKGGFHHSKIMLVDDEVAYAGSANLDSRSLRCDYEVNALILDREATAQLRAVFDRDKARHCVPLTDAFWHQRVRGKRFGNWLCTLLTPFL